MHKPLSEIREHNGHHQWANAGDGNRLILPLHQRQHDELAHVVDNLLMSPSERPHNGKNPAGSTFFMFTSYIDVRAAPRLSSLVPPVGRRARRVGLPKHKKVASSNATGLLSRAGHSRYTFDDHRQELHERMQHVNQSSVASQQESC